jgi:16S rRNA C967 or C1407 C5-methylase (RsmB/RsmF family)
MKTNLLPLCFIVLFSLNACSQDLKKLDNTEVDSEKLKIAQAFANDFFSGLKNDSYYEFNDVAIDELKNQMSEENQKALYKQLKSQFGDFQFLEYAETWIQSNNKSVQINRFKGEFEKSNKKLEIRVVVNDSNKIAGLWVKPWSDMLQ